MKAIYFRLPLFLLAALGIWLLVAVIPYPEYTISTVILVAAGLLAGFIDYKLILLLLFLALPFSIDIPLGLGDSKILFPSELISVVLAIALMVRFLFFTGFKKSFFAHPVTIFILFYGLVLVFTSITSTIPLVSLKFTFINLLYISVFYFLTYLYFSDRPKNYHLLYYIYGISAFLVIIFILYKQSILGFSKGTASDVTWPFYSDHAIYSACLAMLFPAFAAFSFLGRKLGLRIFIRVLSLVVLFAISAGLIFSYSRAAWVSLVVAFIFLLCLLVRVKPAYLLVAILAAGIILLFNRNSILDSLELNKYSSSSHNPTIEQETKSITNISSDISNAERINRWSCAYRMFLDRPLTGYGPGTFQFQYLSYQRPSEMTYISVVTAYNNPAGKGGSAHSEYLLALSESGIFGFIGILGIVLLSVFYGMTAYYRSQSKKEKIMIAVALLAIITYSSHVVFNNYLNVDKTASLFWMSICLIVTLDSKNRKRKELASGELEDRTSELEAP